MLISIQDDGPGVDWAGDRPPRRASGPARRQPPISETALFTDGISSPPSATRTSGRGVGLGAVRAAVDRLGGRLELSTVGASGSLFRCWLPANMLEADPMETGDTGRIATEIRAEVSRSVGVRLTPTGAHRIVSTT